MFEKETYPEDLSSINIAAYSSEKSETKCELPCNSIVLFILLGTSVATKDFSSSSSESQS